MRGSYWLICMESGEEVHKEPVTLKEGLKKLREYTAEADYRREYEHEYFLAYDVINYNKRKCINCTHFNSKDSTCCEGGFSEIGNPEKIMTGEDCNAFKDGVKA